jgi:outer membrane protein assembly factor BamD
MTTARFLPVRGAALCAALCLVLTAGGACVRPMRMPAPGEREPDKYLFDRGSEALERHRWIEARLYFQQLVDQYPQSPHRQEARLGIGDSYLGEGGYDSLILAAEKFREFLRFFPLNERADYAQYKVGLSEYEQMLAPERDQTATATTLRELDAFIQRFPNSQYMPEVLKLQRAALDRRSDSEFRVGQFYFRTRWYRGAIPRFQSILKEDPAYTRRDAVYFYLAETFNRSGQPKQALPYYEKLVEEFRVSEYLEDARLRITELTR